MKTTFAMLFISLSIQVMICTRTANAQSALDQLNTVNSSGFQGEIKGGSSGFNIPAVSNPTCVNCPTNTSSPSKVLPTASESVSSMVSGMVMQGLINSMFSSNTQADQAKQQAEMIEQAKIAAQLAQQKKTADSLAQIKHDELMSNIKTMPGEAVPLNFKTLNGEAEALRAGAGEGFDQSGTTGQALEEIPNATNFFGITLSQPEINTLMDPYNDPTIVDLRNANNYIVDNLKTEKEIANSTNESNAQKETPTEEKAVKENKPLSPECLKIQNKLDGFLKNRENFQKTIDLTQSELSAWQEQNNKAFWNAVSDGISSTAGMFIDYIKDTRESAGLILKNLEANEAKYLSNKIFTPAEITKYKSILKARMLTFDVSEMASNFKEVPDFYDFVSNSMRATMQELAKTNAEYAAMYEDPRFIECFSAFPKVEMGQYLSSKALEKFLVEPLVKKSIIKKLPYVSIAQLAVNEIYNATDMITSYYTICKLRDADGKALEAAKYLQQKINETQIQLDHCK